MPASGAEGATAIDGESECSRLCGRCAWDAKLGSHTGTPTQCGVVWAEYSDSDNGAGSSTLGGAGGATARPPNGDESG